MAKTITQKIVFKNAKAGSLYDMFLNAKQHRAITGGNPAKISSKEGSSFSVHGGYVVGKNLRLIKGKLIVQSWFGSDWDKNELDSILILRFDQQGKDAILHMTHANVPDKNADGIRKGWTEYYWKPWKELFSDK